MRLDTAVMALVLATLHGLSPVPSDPPASPNILVFTKTAGYRHTSIDTAVSAIKKLGRENNFAVETTSNTTLFTEKGLRKYAAVIFVNTTGDILNTVQQAEFERYIQAGGGF